MQKAHQERGRTKYGGFWMNMTETEEAEDVEMMFCEYFVNLFTSTNPSEDQIEAIL